MRILIKNLLVDKTFEASGTDVEVERVLRKHFPGIALGIDYGDVGALVYEVQRLPYLTVQVLEGPVPSPQPALVDVSYGMHKTDDPWPREADRPRDPGEPEPHLPPYEENWEEVLE